MSEKTARPASDKRGETFVEEAKAAGLARLEEAHNDLDAVAWAERNADRLERRLRERNAS